MSYFLGVCAYGFSFLTEMPWFRYFSMALFAAFALAMLVVVLSNPFTFTLALLFGLWILTTK